MMTLQPLTVDQVRAAMEERGLRVVDLANLIELDPNKLAKVLSGTRRFQADEMMRLHQVLRGPVVPAQTSAVRMIPIIGQVAAGNWQEAVQRPIGMIPAFSDTIGEQAYALELAGDSMDLIAPDGGVAVVDPNDKSLHAGGRYVVMNDEGDTTFKEFALDPARLVPLSSNPHHRDILLGTADRFTVVGRVNWVARRT